MVKTLDAIKIYEIAESGNSVQRDQNRTIPFGLLVPTILNLTQPNIKLPSSIFVFPNVHPTNRSLIVPYRYSS